MWWMLAGAAVGALFGGINTARERQREKGSIEQQRKNAQAQYKYQNELSDNQYGIQKGEALWQLGMQKQSLHDSLGQFSDQFNTHLLSRSYAGQDAQIQTNSAIGASMAYDGMNGTRGNDASQLTRDYISKNLDRQMEVQNRSDANTLSATTQNADRATAAIEHEKAAWETGGYRNNMKEAGDLYNKKMYELGQDNFDYYLNDINNNTFLDYAAGIIGGGISGFNFGAGIHQLSYNTDWNNMDWKNIFKYGRSTANNMANRNKF